VVGDYESPASWIDSDVSSLHLGIKVKSGGKPAAEADAAIVEKLGKSYADL